VVGLGSDHEHGRAQRGQIDPLAPDGELTARQLVPEVQPLQILTVHAPGHARAVGVPGHEIVELGAFATHVLIDPRLPQQVARAQQGECRSHALALAHP